MHIVDDKALNVQLLDQTQTSNAFHDVNSSQLITSDDIMGASIMFYSDFDSNYFYTFTENESLPLFPPTDPIEVIHVEQNSTSKISTPVDKNNSRLAVSFDEGMDKDYDKNYTHIHNKFVTDPMDLTYNPECSSSTPEIQDSRVEAPADNNTNNSHLTVSFDEGIDKG